MAGYLFAYNDEDALFESMSMGRYSTLMSARWGSAHLPTLGDYVTMKPGDKVYFFAQRMVYGIGEIIDLVSECTVLENREGVTKNGTLSIAGENETYILRDPEPPVEERKRKAYRWVVAFEPGPFMFKTGVDMDDLLSSNPSAFRSLRVFERRSFIKLDDEEELAFRTAILRRNAETLRHPSSQGIMDSQHITEGERILGLVSGRDVSLKTQDLIASYRKRDGSLQSESILEVALLDQLGNRKDPKTVEVFGEWDFISHQVAASPAKSIQYMDRMDIFGYRWLEPTDKIIGKYYVAELKRGRVCGEDLQQVMKYVDWLRAERANGDYSLIRAFLVGYDFDTDSIRGVLPTAERYNLLGYRPPRPRRWLDITFVAYKVEESGYVHFTKALLA